MVTTSIKKEEQKSSKRIKKEKENTYKCTANDIFLYTHEKGVVIAKHPNAQSPTIFTTEKFAEILEIPEEKRKDFHHDLDLDLEKNNIKTIGIPFKDLDIFYTKDPSNIMVHFMGLMGSPKPQCFGFENEKKESKTQLQNDIKKIGKKYDIE